MFKKSILFILLSVFCFVSYAESEQDGGVKLREGRIIKVDNPSSFTLIDTRKGVLIAKPAKGMKYLRVFVELAAGKSLGLIDYYLAKNEKTDTKFKAVLIGQEGDAAYNPELWAVSCKQDGDSLDNYKFRNGWKSVPVKSLVSLCFEVPEDYKALMMIPFFNNSELRLYKGFDTVEISFEKLEAKTQKVK